MKKRIKSERNQSGWANALRQQISSHKSNNLQMIVCIVTNQNKQTYDLIKRICLVDHGLSSQVITSQNLTNDKKKVAVIGKVAIQLNCKLGGEAWGVKLLIQNTMVIGIDLHKNTSDRRKCVAAFVSSMNAYHGSAGKFPFSCTKYYSRCKMQSRSNIGIDCLYEFMTGYFEIIDKFKLKVAKSYWSITLDALNKYLEKNAIKPDKILIYRDGVGDGDLKILIDIEKLVFKLMIFSRLLNPRLQKIKKTVCNRKNILQVEKPSQKDLFKNLKSYLNKTS